MRWIALLLALCLSMTALAQTGTTASQPVSLETLIEAIGLPAAVTDFTPVDSALGADPLLAHKAVGDKPDAQRAAQFAQAMACGQHADFACALRLWHELAAQQPASWQPEAYALALWQLGQHEAAITWYDHATVIRARHGIASQVEERVHRLAFAGNALEPLFVAWSAQRAPLRKTVLVDVEIDREGNPTRVQVHDDGLDPALRAQIQSSVAGWKLAPAKFDEQSVASLASTAYVEVRGRPVGESQMRFDIIYTGFGPRAIRQVAPVYPRGALQRYREGSVMLRADYDAKGAVQAVRVTEPSGSPLLDRAALTALRRWHFEPIRVEGVPQAHYAMVPFVFHMDDGPHRFLNVRRERDAHGQQPVF